MSEQLELAEWRRVIAETYTAARGAPDPVAGWHLWREQRARLFREHPQSPLPPEQRDSDHLPRYFEYDPAWRVLGVVEDATPMSIALPGSGEETFAATRFGVVRGAAAGYELTLGVFWLSGYAGGLFVSFRDAGGGSETYGAGRYLLDTAKGADLGADGERVVLDFNFAYQPSCSYDPRWSCPVAPRDNWLDFPVRAGERL